MALAVPPPAHCPHAVVIGAGPDGLALAHVLGHRLERVTLIERDDVPDREAHGRAGSLGRHDAALRRVLESPGVVVRAGLEVVGLAVSPGRVRGVEVAPRRSPEHEPVTIPADLVVDATGFPHDRAVRLPDGLIVAGRAPDGGEVSGRPRTIRPQMAAAALGRGLDEHLRRRGDLSGFSATAQDALARCDAGAAAPAAR